MDGRLDYKALRDGLVRVPDLDVAIDLTTLPVSDSDARILSPRLDAALSAMAELESGAISNPDEGRMVGHYWLRAPELAPSAEIRSAIESTRARIAGFAEGVRSGKFSAPDGAPFEHVLHVGIGGSALGPQLVCDALCQPEDRIHVSFLDNTDPDGIDRTLRAIGERLPRTLSVVVSKSGGTKETRNGLELLLASLSAAGLDASPRLVAVTGEGSALDRRAREEGWLDVFPMWDWVGGRTSLTSAVGLVTLSVAGHDVDALLDGARRMDAATREPDVARNPAARLAMSWHVACGGRGTKDMVVIPYKDRLSLLSRYLQQLVMESLGKERDLDGRVVHQGLTVYGNKGSTDQHAYIQQLREGVNNFFATLVAVMEDGGGDDGVDVEEGARAGDFLLGFLLGTRRALTESGRFVQTIFLPRVDARTMGALIALFERTVGLYASMININAYHQPGVEAGKRAAGRVLDLQRALVEELSAKAGSWATADAWAGACGQDELAVEALWVLEHLAANRRAGVVRRGAAGDPAAEFSVAKE